MGIVWKKESPVYDQLEAEGIQLKPFQEAQHQDIRPIEVAMLNLMPKKDTTVKQFLRGIGDTPLQINFTPLYTETYEPQNTPIEYLREFYKTFSQVRQQCFDALIVTGAPVETEPFESVKYWEELKEILEWARTQVTSTYYSCWGAMAALYHHYGIDKQPLPEKLSGVFWHRHNNCKDLMRGTDDMFLVPHSRYTEVDHEAVKQHPDLRVVVQSARAGIHMMTNRNLREVYAFGHPEYDADTLGLEYERDRLAGLQPKMPVNYYPANNPQFPPINLWRANGNVVIRNWINWIYQITPYDISEIPQQMTDFTYRDRAKQLGQDHLKGEID